MEDLPSSHIEDSEQQKNAQQNPSEYSPVGAHFDVPEADTEQQNTDLQLVYELYPNDPVKMAEHLDGLFVLSDEYA